MRGIYAIRNKVNGKVYIGQSHNIQKRFRQHLDALEKGIHHSKKLQEDFDEFGADKFALEVLELCRSDQLDQKEMEWIAKFDALRNGYNVQDPSTRRKTWFGFKRQKRPVVTVRGELSRIIYDLVFEMIENFKSWATENKEEAKKSIILLIGISLIVIGCLIFGGSVYVALIMSIGFMLICCLLELEPIDQDSQKPKQ